MKKHLLILVLCAFFFEAKAQLGITAASTQSHAPEWQVVPENFILHRRADFLRYGTTAVVDYVFTLKNEAMRLRPALHFMHTSSVYHPHYFQAGVIGLQGNLEFALWPAVDKGGRETPFRPFVQLSPGVALASFRYDRPVSDQNGVFEVHKSRSIAPNVGANLFLEFKLSELLTAAPMAGIRFYPKLYWKDFTQIVTDGNMSGTYDRTNWRQYSFGLRVGLTFR